MLDHSCVLMLLLWVLQRALKAALAGRRVRWPYDDRTTRTLDLVCNVITTLFQYSVIISSFFFFSFVSPFISRNRKEGSRRRYSSRHWFCVIHTQPNQSTKPLCAGCNNHVTSCRLTNRQEVVWRPLAHHCSLSGRSSSRLPFSLDEA